MRWLVHRETQYSTGAHKICNEILNLSWMDSNKIVTDVSLSCSSLIKLKISLGLWPLACSHIHIIWYQRVCVCVISKVFHYNLFLFQRSQGVFPRNSSCYVSKMMRRCGFCDFRMQIFQCIRDWIVLMRDGVVWGTGGWKRKYNKCCLCKYRVVINNSEFSEYFPERVLYYIVFVWYYLSIFWQQFKVFPLLLYFILFEVK